jgi:protein involved in polysaccharide export with SLBB domain
MEDRKMRFALRTAVCCATLVAALWPTKAIGDEATLKRTAPDECIAWFSWAGFDALAKGENRRNRTEQLLADEEVQAFLDALAKNLDGAMKIGSDEETKQLATLLRALKNRPAVAYLSRLAEVKQAVPPKAPEPPVTPPQATIAPTVTTTIGEDGLERIGIDFDVQVTAGDMPATPTAEPSYGRMRKVIVNGTPRREIEIRDSQGTRWEEIEVDFDFDLDDNKPGSNADRGILSSAYELPFIERCANAIATAYWVAQQPNAEPECTPSDAPQGNSELNLPPAKPLAEPSSGTNSGRADLDWEDGWMIPFDPAKPATVSTPADRQRLIAKLHDGFQASRAHVVPVSEPNSPIPPPSPSATPVPAPAGNGDLSPDATFSGPVGHVFPSSPHGPPVVPLGVPAGVMLHPAAAAQINGECGTCATCSDCPTCNGSTTTTVAHGAVVVDLGEHAAELKSLYEKMATESGDVPTQRISEVDFAKLAWAQPVWLAFHEGYLILAFDEGSAEQCVAGIAGKREVPKWLVDAEAKLPVERPAARLHVNIDGITKLVDEPFEEPSKEAIKLLGLDQVSAISFVAGLDDHGTAIKTLIATRDGGDASAVLDFFGEKGLVADDLKVVPKDATMAASGKIDVKRIVEVGFKLAQLDDDEAESAIDATKKYLAEHLFIDLTKDIVEAIGDTWTLHYAPSEGGLMATTFTLTVRDEARLRLALEKLALVANSDDAKVRKFTYRGQDVYYLQAAGESFSAAWCIRDGRLVASMLPQTIKAHIARGPLKETLADIPQLSLLKAEGKGEIINYPLMLSYTDTRGILQWCYQYGSFLLPTIGQQLSQAEDCTLALHDLPSLAVIEHYFAPSITTLSRTDAGLVIDSRQTVPMMSGVFALTTLASMEGLGLDGMDPNDLVAFSSSTVQLPFGVSMDSPIGMRNVGVARTPPVVYGECTSGACSAYPVATPYAAVPPALPSTPYAVAPTPGPVAPSSSTPYSSIPPSSTPYSSTPPQSATIPSPYYYEADVQYSAPPAAATPQPAPAARSEPSPSAPGPGMHGPGPTTFAPYVPNSTPVPYAPSNIGGAYVAPPATPPNLPAAYQSPYAPPPLQLPGPPQVPQGKQPAASPVVPTATPPKPGMSYPKPSSAPSGASAPYGGKEHPNPPLSKPVPADNSSSYSPNTTQPGIVYPYYKSSGPRDWYEPDPSPIVTEPKCEACTTATQVTASDQPVEKTKEYGVPFGKPNAKLFRRVTESPNERTIQGSDMLELELIQGTPKSPYRIEPMDMLQIVADGTRRDAPVAGEYVVDPGGFVHLGEPYGRERVKDLTIAKARDVIEKTIHAKAPEAKVSINVAKTVFQQRISSFHSLNPEGSLVIGSDSVKVEGLSLDAAKTKIEEMLSTQLDSPKIELSFASDVKMNETSEEPAAESPNDAKPVNPAVWAQDFRLHHSDVVTVVSATIAPKASHKLAPGEQFGLTIAKDADSTPFETTDEVRENGSIDLGDEFGVVPVAGRTVGDVRNLIRRQVRKTSPNARVQFELSICQQRDLLTKDYPIQDDGTIDLDKYGQANVVGCTLVEARSRIEAKLQEHFGDVEVQLDVTPSGMLTKTGARKGLYPGF